MIKSIDYKVGLGNEIIRDKWVIKTLKNLKTGLNLLDAGAGEGKYRQDCRHLKYTSQDFLGYDGRGDGRGLQTHKWDYRQIDIVSDIVNIPKPNRSFDAVLCTEVFEHIPDPISALKEFHRLLKPGGKLVLTAPFCSLTHMSPYHYYTDFNAYFYKYWLEKLGFKIQKIKINGNYFEYLAQELRRLHDVVSGYTDLRYITTIIRLATVPLLFLCQLASNHDKQNSGSLLCFGYHILAEKQI